MKIEETRYVLQTKGNMNINRPTQFLDINNEFTDNILLATKCINYTTALTLKYDYDVKNGKEDLEIIVIKQSTEW